MRFAVAVCVVLASATAGAVVPRATTARPAADTLTALPAANVKAPLRVQQQLVARRAPSPLFERFVARAGGTWEVAWDRATGVPTRIWGSGIAVAGAIASPAIAEAAARAVLAEHIALLAPGALVIDFELVSNVYDGNVRAVGFVQRAGGLRVVGGQVSFRFKNDRLFVIGSEALPGVAAPAPRVRIDAALLAARATASLRAQLALPSAPASPLEPDVILPLVGDDTVLGYRVVQRMELDGGADGRYAAYVDPASAQVIAIHQLNDFATGTVLYHSVDRYPGRGYIDRPAPHAYVSLDAANATTASDGTVAWSDSSTQTLGTTATGDYVGVTNTKMGGAMASAQLSLAAGGTATWDASAVVDDDAQVAAFIDTNIAKQYVRDFLDPNMPNLDAQLPVKVNENQTCNAFWDGKSLNFFEATPVCMPNMSCCENTARVQDVNFHEFGHDVHGSEIITGVGAFDGAMSEGAADFFCASITGDHGMGRGFFYSDEPLRDLDNTATWPTDVGEIHQTGKIFGGAFWDLRVALIAQFGNAQGVAITDAIFLGVLRRATGISTALIEALVTDDDNGNLSDGTPHECQIRAAFAKHGLRTSGGFVEAPGTLDDNALSIGVAIDVTGLSPRCPGDVVNGATLAWRPSFTGMPLPGSAPGQPDGANRFWAELPLAIGESVLYQAVVAFADGSMMVLPDNIADSNYQLYQGPTIPLYCTDFETDPFAAGWTQSAGPGEMSQWQWGVPSGNGCATCPPSAYSGTHILAEVLDGDYPDSSYGLVTMPTIFVGQYSNVRLQYRRWLAVEDSHFDQARITTNGLQAWQNATQNIGGSSAYHHIDKEWRFQDVALSPWFIGHTVTVGWDLKSDAGLHFSGWQLDDVCIVADVTQICGDGIVDTGEECDAGPMGSPTCSTKCKIIAASGGGCCSASGDAAGSLALGAAVLALAMRRRRRS